MSRLALTRRERRALLASGSFIAAIVLAGRGVPAWRHWIEEARAEAIEASNELARAEASVRREPAAAESLAVRERRFVGLAPAILSGRTPAAAGATLAALLSGAASAAGMRLDAVEVRADSAARGAFAKVAVRGSATGDVKGLAMLLTALERGPTLLAVREIAVAQPEPAAAADRMETLRVDLLVEGLMLSPRFSADDHAATRMVR